MDFYVWLSFLAASLLLCFSPGPTTFLAIGQSLKHGKISVIPIVAGTLAGDMIAMTLSFVGVGAILATSAVLFNLFKWIGALYLIYLGIKAFRAKASTPNQQGHSTTSRTAIFRNAMLVTALNPKGIIFFMTFFPLFIDPQQAVLTQMILLGLTFQFAAASSVSIYACFAGALSAKTQNPNVQNVFNKVSGGLLISAGAVTASLSHKV
ncbi:MAG: LysE family translocator [Pseudomonadales bacterium]